MSVTSSTFPASIYEQTRSHFRQSASLSTAKYRPPLTASMLNSANRIVSPAASKCRCSSELSDNDSLYIPVNSDSNIAAVCQVLFYHIWVSRSNPANLFSGSANAITGQQRRTFRLFCERLLRITTVTPACDQCPSGLAKAAAASSALALVALKYVQRLILANPSCQGDEGFEFRLFAIALMIAHKMFEDRVLAKSVWSEVTGINVKELAVMEIEFLNGIDWNLNIDLLEWNEYVSNVVEMYAEGLRISEARVVPTANLQTSLVDKWSLSKNYAVKRGISNCEQDFAFEKYSRRGSNGMDFIGFR
ncbi:hypothetical protein HK096_008992 [Nowakowskiella sp. JEL0078]|nr:hypothetical protein HK096_008992 [Nowakowskiella sp. JEL0078]